DPVLPARRRAARDHDLAHLCRRDPVRADPTVRAGRAVVRAATGDRVATGALRRVMDMKAAQIFDLSGRVALVTGASSGLGRRFAEVLAANGAAVALVARRADKLADAKAAIEKSGGKAVAIDADVLDRSAMKRAFDQAEQTLGTVTILVNNAGVAHSTRAL